MNERVKFVAACLAREDTDETFAELCERFEIAPKTGYKWLHRYEEGGVAIRVGDRGSSSSSYAESNPSFRYLQRARWGSS